MTLEEYEARDALDMMREKAHAAKVHHFNGHVEWSDAALQQAALWAAVVQAERLERIAVALEEPPTVALDISDAAFRVSAAIRALSEGSA